MNNSMRTLRLAQFAVRNFSKTGVNNTEAVKEVVRPQFNKLKETQARFQIEDGLPVHLKGGIGDRILYGITVALTLTCVGLSVKSYVELINK